MKYFASDIDSFLFFHRFGRRAVERAQVVQVTSLEGGLCHASDLFGIDLDGAGLSIPRDGIPGSLCPMAGESGKRHVLVVGSVNRHRCKGISRSKWEEPIPPNSFARIAPGVCVSMPGFIFLQLARRLSFTQLILVGCVLCAAYYIGPDGEPAKRRPITSTTEIAKYLDGAKGIRWSRVARKALSFVAEGAESPQEINSYMLTCLPRELGGCGVRKLSLNYLIPVLPEDASIVDKPERTNFRVDMGDPDAHAGSEYLGKLHEKTVDEDRARLNALLAKGERLLQVKYADLVDPVLAERHAHQLAALLGEECNDRTPEEELANIRLKELLFGPNRPRI